jgi:hypothetical protein
VPPQEEGCQLCHAARSGRQQAVQLRLTLVHCRSATHPQAIGAPSELCSKLCYDVLHRACDGDLLRASTQAFNMCAAVVVAYRRTHQIMSLGIANPAAPEAHNL